MNNTKFSSMAVAGALCAFAALPSTAADVQPELPAEITLKPYGDPRNVMISR